MIVVVKRAMSGASGVAVMIAVAVAAAEREGGDRDCKNAAAFRIWTGMWVDFIGSMKG